MAEPAVDVSRTLAQSDAIPNDFVVPFYLQDRKLRISIARVHERLYAFDDLCTCAEPACPLSGGQLTGTTIMCQCHGSRFDVVTGTVISGPASRPLTVYAVRDADGMVQVET
jgi:nitrite reductase/ring-hydroxylating ferredoxin subunit